MVSCFAIAVAAAWIGAGPRVEQAERIVFLGDSITYAGTFVQDVEAYLATRFPDRPRRVLNLGLPSETASGLSEKEHPWPRPTVHERLARALDATHPDLVVASYGMNDGIFHPFDEGRFAAFRSGMEGLHEQATRAGASVLIATPFPFDVRPTADKARPLGADDYGYSHPYVDYDRTLGRYARWLVGQKERGWAVADVHSPASQAMASFAALDPTYAMARDGIHPGPAGHWLIAESLLAAWGLPEEVDDAAIDAKAMAATQGRVEGLANEDGTIRFAWTTRVPMPHAAGWDRLPAGAPPRIDRFNRHRLAVAGLPDPRYVLMEDGRRIGEFDRAALAGGIDLTALPDLSSNRRSAAIRPILEVRSRMLAAAWLFAIGHKRPGVAPGLPLEEAQEKAEAMDREIRRLAHPVPIRLELRPVAR
ncbi:SGNH/GDSL hydrolase family protein [Tundrisphaera sp. TA3]|uniref:SGNH/GDSL hydrolase family protein n=1 Tax=Tundrisphaera sp. TA3 TaxID=3435775 RepID=UPI003EBA90AB